MSNFWKNKKVLVTGGAGFLGSYVVKKMLDEGLLSKNISIPRSKDFDLRSQEACAKVVENADIVIHLAANVGGIGYNLKNPGTLFYDNILMGVHLLEESRKAGVKKFVGIGTVCAYPKYASVPFREENLWDGYPEETNAPYGLAKKMLLVQSQAYRQQYNFNSIYLLPVNLYGPGDNFNPSSSHVISALIRKFVEARQHKLEEVIVWGTGKATREFLYVEDAANAILLATKYYDKSEPINIGSNSEISIKELAETICKLVGFTGRIVWDKTKPDGQPRRRLSTIKAKKEFNFKSTTKFRQGLKATITWYEENII